MDDYLVIFVIVALGFVVYYYREKIFPDLYANYFNNKKSDNNYKYNKYDKRDKRDKRDKYNKKKVSFRENVSVKEFNKDIEDIEDTTDQTFNFDEQSQSNESGFSEESFNKDNNSANSFGSLNSSMSGGFNELDSKLSILE